MRVGILGGGQLGAMLADAVARLGASPVIFDPDPDVAARRRGAEHVTGSFDDVNALWTFCAGCDVVTYEREDLPVETLRLAARDTRFVPDLTVLQIAQDRALEKQFLSRAGLACVRHVIVDPGVPLDEACVAFGLPAIAKTTRGGYDGKGQFFLRCAADAAAAQAALPGAAWVLEEPVDILTEASCIVARSEREEVTFPVVENLHRAHILDRSLVPSRLPQDIEARIRVLTLAAARALNVRGLLAVEFFIPRPSGPAGSLDASSLVINELAPRPHNSGHVLSRACVFGQFDALAGVLVGAPLGWPTGRPSSFCMGNLLGDVWLAQGRDDSLDVTALQAFPDVIDVQDYGKRAPEPRRKMGHFIVQSSSAADALHRAEAFRTALLDRSFNSSRGRD